MRTGITTHGNRRHIQWLWKNIYDDAWSFAGRWHVEEIRPGAWMVAEFGAWKPVEHPCIQSAMQAAEGMMA